MASNIDASVPADNVRVEKSDVRNNFANAKSEIEDLQRATSLPWRLATGQSTI